MTEVFAVVGIATLVALSCGITARLFDGVFEIIYRWEQIEKTENDLCKLRHEHACLNYRVVLLEEKAMEKTRKK